jgi:hypothetical protein
MHTEALWDRLRAWSFPLGPLVTPEDVAAEMDAEARRLGPDAGSELARLAITLEEAEGDDRIGALYDFVEVYARHHPEALSRALLGALRPDGPPVVVELLASVPDRGVVEALQDLLVSLASTLGELGGQPAGELVRRLEARDDLGEAARRELSIAKVHISAATRP